MQFKAFLVFDHTLVEIEMRHPCFLCESLTNERLSLTCCISLERTLKNNLSTGTMY